MKPQSHIDGFLVEHGQALFALGPSRSVKSPPRSQLTGLRLKSGLSPAKILSTSARAKLVRQNLRGITRRVPEVVIKISGGGKGMVQIKNHFDYISRNGQIGLETHDGEGVRGRAGLWDLREAWQHGDVQYLPEVSHRREAFNIVLSMPEGTDPEGLKLAVRDFAAKTFKDHQYVMALHTFDTDPDKDPARHPHVHLTVRAEAIDGRRLNPRKADLQRWREGFRDALKDHGIEANATPRQARFNRYRGVKKSVSEKRGRGEALDHIGVSEPDEAHIEAAKGTELKVKQSYKAIAEALARSDTADDRKLSVEIARYYDQAVNGRELKAEAKKKQKDMER